MGGNKFNSAERCRFLLIHVVTVPDSLVFFRGQLRYLKEQGVQIHAVSSPGEMVTEMGIREDIPIHGIEMAREIDLFKDLRALGKLFTLFRLLKPDIVHAHFPKGGLLGVIAARLARVPIVIYNMHGLRFVTVKGFKRQLLKSSESLSCHLAHRVLAVSNTVRQQAVNYGICEEERISVLALGSINGVDAVGNFNPQRMPSAIRQEFRGRYQIPREAILVGFVGRIVRDKGIAELESAWQLLKNRFPNLFLLLVGPVEGHDPVPPMVLDSLKNEPRVRFAGSVTETAPFYAAMDILVLPTHREGFPITPLEAAAMELPVVATTVDGCVEAVANGVTGFLVPPRDSQALAAAIERLVLDPKLRQQMGLAGRQRVLRDFRPETLWQAQYQHYRELIGAGGQGPD